MRVALLLLACGAVFAQTNVLTVTPPARLQAKRGDSAAVKVHLQMQAGYHSNSNTPSDEYLIPLKLTWPSAPLEATEVVYPKPSMEKYEFSPKPLSVFSGDFEVTTKFKVPANAPTGMAIVTGKLRYQACNDRLCLPPKTLEVPLTVDIR
jgi:Disulphide bond corrector protein DsbC